MTFRLEFKKTAAREFAALPKQAQQRVEELLTLLAISPSRRSVRSGH
jgi:mRNA-degrading endonuclease RelE of RelBE toxin-antitoxin system